MFFFKSIKIKNQYYSTWVLIFFLSALFGALDSCFVLFMPMRNTFVGMGMNTDWAKYATIGMIGIYVIIIDYSLSVFYPNSINELISAARQKSRDGAQWSIAVLTFIFCVIQIFITIQVSIQLRHSAAALFTDKPQTVKVDSIIAVQTAAQAQTASTLSKAIDNTKSEKQKAIEKAQNNKELQRLKSSGNGWAVQKLNGLAKDAGSKYESSIKDMNTKYTTLLSQNAENIKIIAEATAKQNEFENKIYEQKTDSMSNFFLFFAIGATFIMCFSGLLIGIYRATHHYGNQKTMTDANRNDSNYQQQNNGNGNYQQSTSGKATSNYGNYQVNTDKVEFDGQLYEPTAIKRWAQNSDRRAETAKTAEKKKYFTEQAARLWATWEKYSQSQSKNVTA